MKLTIFFILILFHFTGNAQPFSEIRGINILELLFRNVDTAVIRHHIEREQFYFQDQRIPKSLLRKTEYDTLGRKKTITFYDHSQIDSVVFKVVQNTRERFRLEITFRDSTSYIKILHQPTVFDNYYPAYTTVVSLPRATKRYVIKRDYEFLKDSTILLNTYVNSGAIGKERFDYRSYLQKVDDNALFDYKRDSSYKKDTLLVITRSLLSNRILYEKFYKGNRMEKANVTLINNTDSIIESSKWQYDKLNRVTSFIVLVQDKPNAAFYRVSGQWIQYLPNGGRVESFEENGIEGKIDLVKEFNKNNLPIKLSRFQYNSVTNRKITTSEILYKYDLHKLLKTKSILINGKLSNIKSYNYKFY